jgi:hypothetical protein
LHTETTWAGETNRVSYTLLGGSYLIDDCLICARPTIEEPLQGTFDLVLLQDTPPYTKYAVQNVAFSTSSSTWLQRQIKGDGVYVRFEEFALLQDMNLALNIEDPFTNRLAFFTNDSSAVQKPFPLIQVDLRQTNGTLLQAFSLHLVAAPLHELWLSTTLPFTSTNRFAPTNQISAGDLISNRGRVVKRNSDLAGPLGIMPIVPDVGLDGVQVTTNGEILFSIPIDIFSETLGPIQHGDLLSNKGIIIKRNQDLLAGFGVASTTLDAGLEGFQVMPTGEILFSIQTNVVVSKSLTLGRGDILSDRGQVYLTHQQLLGSFHMANTNYDFGLRAFFIWPGGEVWFSVEEGFSDDDLGSVQAGDLLSSLGYRVFRNQDLLAAFAPADPSQDYGLDALFVVTDLTPAKPPPQIQSATWSQGAIHMQWDGEGSVFQVEQAPDLNGEWVPLSPILPARSYDVKFDKSPGNSFFRLRQW